MYHLRLFRACLSFYQATRFFHSLQTSLEVSVPARSAFQTFQRGEWRTGGRVNGLRRGYTWVCNSPPVKVFHLGHTAEATKSGISDWRKSEEWWGELSGRLWREWVFLMSPEDPRMGSWGCQGARYSVSGRRRWRDRRCILVRHGFHSDSESL